MKKSINSSPAEPTRQELFMRQHQRHHRQISILRLLLLVLFLILWEVSSRTGAIDSFFFSSPSKVAVLLWEMCQNYSIFGHLGITLFETLVSFLLVFLVSAEKGQGVDELKSLLRGKTTTVAGPSGVGKSSLVNCFQDNIRMQTGSISEKIDRGKHTTRHSEFIVVAEDTYILDTPGFSSLGLFDLTKENLADCYPEFARYEKYCRFAGCSHVSEPVCGVRDAVEAGEIARMRYENYRLLYEELKAERRKK